MGITDGIRKLMSTSAAVHAEHEPKVEQAIRELLAGGMNDLRAATAMVEQASSRHLYASAGLALNDKSSDYEKALIAALPSERADRSLTDLVNLRSGLEQARAKVWISAERLKEEVARDRLGAQAGLTEALEQVMQARKRVGVEHRAVIDAISEHISPPKPQLADDLVSRPKPPAPPAKPPRDGGSHATPSR